MGQVYLSCSTGGGGLARLINSKADCEFGVNFVTDKQLTSLIASKQVVPSVIVDGPAPALIKINHPEADVILSLEYTYGPFQASKLKASYAKSTKEEKADYQKVLSRFENRMLAPYRSYKSIQLVSTGLLKALGEKGLIDTPVLKQMTALLAESSDSTALRQLRQKMFRSLSPRIQQALAENNKLHFGYGYRGTLNFITLHQAYTQDEICNQDLFLVSTNGRIKEKLSSTINSLKEQGYAKVVYYNYSTGKETVLFDNHSDGKCYRVIHADSLAHNDMINLYGLSEPLSLATGDQSFAEAILANKIINYDCLQHKTLLYNAYCDYLDTLSPDTHKALNLLGHQGEPLSEEKTQLLTKLLKKSQVRTEISELNQHIAKNANLVDHYLDIINSKLEKELDELSTSIIKDELDKINEPELLNEHHFFLALRYGSLKIVKEMLSAGFDVSKTDTFGNNAFIIATQNKHYEVLKELLKHAEQNGLPFASLMSANNHIEAYTLFDYLDFEIKNNPVALKALFGSYAEELLIFIDKHHRVPSPYSSPTDSSSPLLEQTLWQALEIQLLADLEHCAEDESIQFVTPFFIVMREHLRDKAEFEDDFIRISEECSAMGITDNWVEEHQDEFRQMQTTVYQYLKENPAFSTFDLNEVEPSTSTKSTKLIKTPQNIPLGVNHQVLGYFISAMGVAAVALAITIASYGLGTFGALAIATGIGLFSGRIATSAQEHGDNDEPIVSISPY